METEESENQSESDGCCGVSAGLGNSRVCLRGCLMSGQGQRWSLGWVTGRMWWSVPWQGKVAALMGCCCRFSLPGRKNKRILYKQ